MNNVLLDTCAVIWIAQNAPFDSGAAATVDQSSVHISAATAWEIANLKRKGRIAFTMSVPAWFDAAVTGMRATVSDLAPHILIASCELPGSPPDDPADRMIIATARERNLTLVTRDKAILRYAGAGHVRALAC